MSYFHIGINIIDRYIFEHKPIVYKHKTNKYISILLLVEKY